MRVDKFFAHLDQQTQAYTDAGGGGMDIRPALPGMDRSAFFAGTVFISDNKINTKALKLELFNRFLRRRPSRNEKVLARLIHVAVEEHYLVNARKCPSCGGVTRESDGASVILRSDLKFRKCKACNGAGNYKVNGTWRANIAGIRRESWSRYYRDIYNEIYMEVAGLTTEANSHINRHVA